MNTDEGDYREAYQRWYHVYNKDPRHVMECFKDSRFVPFERPEPSKTICIGPADVSPPMQIDPYRMDFIQRHKELKAQFEKQRENNGLA